MAEKYCEIPLTRGYVTLVDETDFARISQFKWCVTVSRNGCAYAVRLGPKRRLMYLHKFILDAGAHIKVDHKNRNTLDNRRFNLRKATHTQNLANHGGKRGISGYWGVVWHTEAKRWRAQYFIKSKRVHLGYFSSAEEAAHVRDHAVLAHYGEFATLNFPQQTKE